MPTDHRAALRDIRTFPSLVRYLRDEMGWPIETDDFDEATFDYTPEELGIEAKNRASANSAERQAWAADDLLFVSNYGEGEDRRFTFAHFSQNGAKVIRRSS